MGRWAWSSDALDFDSDGWEDLYVVNGMFTREARPGRTSTASSGGRSSRGRRSTRVKGTPYDDAWRAINQLLVHGSIASHQRNVLLRNDGHGGFDDVSGSGRARPRSGRPLVRGARLRRRRRSGPRGDGGAAGAAAARVPERLRSRAARARASACAGTPSNRDAIGARVTVETDGMRRTEGRAGRLRLPLAALEGAAVRPRREPERS